MRLSILSHEFTCSAGCWIVEIKGVTFTAGAFAGFGGALVAGFVRLHCEVFDCFITFKYFYISLIPAIVSFFVG